MSQPAIEIKNLSKKYRIDHYGKNKRNTIWDVITSTIKKPASLITGDRADHEAFWALKGVDLTIEKGDVVGIIGRNGSGKSTMLKVLSQIVEPTTGTIKMNGRVASLLEVGTGFHPELTGRENIYFNGSILGMSRKEISAKFNDIVEFSEIEKFLDTPVKFYSSGMYVRLAFSVAAHLDPDILIVDEVLAVGDAAFQKKCLGKMKDVAGEGRTVLFVSHSTSAVAQLCNKCVFLKDGSVVSYGKTNDVITDYVNSISASKSTEDKVLESNDFGSIYSISVKGAKEGSVKFGGPFKVSVKFDLKSDMQNLVIGFGIKNISDVPVTTVWSSPADTAKGRYTASVEVKDLILENGAYFVSVGISKDGQTLLSTTSDYGFIIEGASEDPRIVSNSGSGIILNQPPVYINKEK